MTKRQVLKKELLQHWKRWLRFMQFSFLKTFSLYIAISVLMTVLYMGFTLTLKADLDLKPQLTPEAEGSFMIFALALLPITLLLEDLGIRLMPWLFIHTIFRAGSYEVAPNPEKRRWRLWIAHNEISFYIVVSALWNSLIHQSNVFAANPLGRILYFGIHVVTGAMLAWIFIYKGFWQSYTIHVSWDLLLIAVVLIASLF